MARLFILSGDHLGQTLDLERPSKLGRGQEADLMIRGKSVSRLHAHLERGPDGQWVLTDLGSSNGTRVGERRLTGPHTLQDGETFCLGDVELRLRDEEAPHPAPIEPVAVPAPAPTPASIPAPSSGGLELEGDWDAGAQTPDAPIQRPVAAPSPQAKPARQAASQADSATRRAQAMGASAPGAAGRTAAGGKVLQYQKVDNRTGLFSTDIGQQPFLIRVLLYLLLAAVLGGLMWGAYQLTAGLRRTDGSISESE